MLDYKKLIEAAKNAGLDEVEIVESTSKELELNFFNLQKYANIHFCTGEESSGSGTDSTQGLGPGIDGRGIPRGP